MNSQKEARMDNLKTSVVVGMVIRDDNFAGQWIMRTTW